MDGKVVIERPKKVKFRNGVWRAEGGKVTEVELPPEGWILEYDELTGLPSRTSPYKRYAERVFRDDTSYFSYYPDGLRAVIRSFGFGNNGPFHVLASYVPASNFTIVGVRSVSRQI